MFHPSPEQAESIMRRLDFLRIEAGDIARFVGMTQAEYNIDRDRRRSLERLVENIINACTDVAKTVLSSQDLPIPDTYRDAILQLGMSGVLEPTLAEEIAEMTRLRNVLAHQYLDIRWSVLRDFINEAPEAIQGFIKSIECFLHEGNNNPE